jgi:hypothetical protein
LRQGFVTVTAEDQNRDLWRGGVQFVERLETLTIGQGQLEQDSVNILLSQAFKTQGKFANPLDVERTCRRVSKGDSNRIGSGRVNFNQQYF